MRSFVKALIWVGITYVPQYLSPEAYLAIVSTPIERGMDRFWLLLVFESAKNRESLRQLPKDAANELQVDYTRYDTVFNSDAVQCV